MVFIEWEIIPFMARRRFHKLTVDKIGEMCYTYNMKRR